MDVYEIPISHLARETACASKMSIMLMGARWEILYIENLTRMAGFRYLSANTEPFGPPRAWYAIACGPRASLCELARDSPCSFKKWLLVSIDYTILRQGVYDLGGQIRGERSHTSAARHTRTRASSVPQRLVYWPCNIQQWVNTSRRTCRMPVERC